MNRCEEVLAHHGVKGMKWGVRRYQNPDGSLTAAGRKRMEKNDRETVKQIRKNSQVYDAVSEQTGKAVEKSKKKWEKAYTKAVKKGKNTDTKKINKLENQYAFDAAFDKTVKAKQADFRKAANKITNEYISKYGDKKLKSIKTNPDGSIADKHTDEFIKSVLSAPMSYNRQSVQGRANKIYKDNYKREREKFSKQEQSSSQPSKKEQKSNLKELSSLAKKSGATNVIKSINKGTYDQNSNVDDNVARESKVVKKITSADSVKSAVKERDRLSEQWTKANEAFESYVKKKGLPSWDKHAEQSNDATYNRLADKVDAAIEAYDKASEKLKKAVYSEVSKQTGSNPKSSDLEAIDLMISRQLLYD